MLTSRQKQILDFIVAYKRKNRISPTINEIRRHFRLHSPATVHQHLEALKEKGYLDRLKNKTRSLAPSRGDSIKKILERSRRRGFALVRILGSANAGPATLFAEENVEGYLKVPRSAVNREDGVFVLRVEGDSMNKAKAGGQFIEDGDFVVVDSEYKTPTNGDIVLSVINGCANIKKFHRDPKTGGIALLSESTNSAHKSIPVSDEDDFMINGKIIGVIKKAV